MKFQMIAALFIAVLVAVPCFAEEEAPNNDNPKRVAAGEIHDEKAESEDQPGPPNAGSDEEGEKDIFLSDSKEVDEGDESIPQELKDEAQHVKKRRLTQLSHRSCIILRSIGLCRYHVISSRCIRQCRPRRWLCRIPYWCGLNNRRLLRYNLTPTQCANFCVRYVRGCIAIESWHKNLRHCFQCINPRLMRPYRNRRDLAYPPRVCYQHR